MLAVTKKFGGGEIRLERPHFDRRQGSLWLPRCLPCMHMQLPHGRTSLTQSFMTVYREFDLNAHLT